MDLAPDLHDFQRGRPIVFRVNCAASRDSTVPDPLSIHQSSSLRTCTCLTMKFGLHACQHTALINWRVHDFWPCSDLNCCTPMAVLLVTMPVQLDPVQLDPSTPPTPPHLRTLSHAIGHCACSVLRWNAHGRACQPIDSSAVHLGMGHSHAGECLQAGA